MKDPILHNLNAPQKEAVTALDGPFLILAGAGSGKTKTLTHRIVYLMTVKKVPAQSILAVTFTNKAASEMRDRVVSLLNTITSERTSDTSPSPTYYSIPLIGTFHSVCAKILRAEIHHLGYESTFNIMDAQDQEVLIKKTFKKLDLSTKQFSPRTVRETISHAKNDLIDPRDFSKSIDSYYEERVADVYTLYQSALKESNALDFDDLIRLTILLFEKRPDVLAKYQKQFRYILVDEYQDTNHAQYKLISLLAAVHNNLFVVGDDWQSIYAWRFADISNILNFEKDYTQARTIKLEQNYRSTQVILDAAFSVIEHNTDRTNKKIWTDKTTDEKLISYEARDEMDEATFIADTIIALRAEEKRKFGDFVVLYRTNAQSRQIEEMFLSCDIPYRIVGGIKFYARKEVKDIVAYLRLVDNPHDRISLERAISEPRRSIGTKTLEQWLTEAEEQKKDPLAYGSTLSPEITKLAQKKQTVITNFCKMILLATEKRKDLSLTELISFVYKKSGYESALLKEGTEGEVRHENVQELLSVAKKYDQRENALQEFLEEVSLAADTDKIDADADSVHLMTLHSAKGLEFPIVFITGLEEGLLPHSRAMLAPTEMEEERRLMYVGITRAMEKVHLLFTRERLLFGQTQMNAPSRFLDDIPQHLIEKNSAEVERADKQFFSQKKESMTGESSGNTQRFLDGDKVRHNDFGEGVVVAQDDDVITIVFKQKGLKKLAKSVAPLEKL